MDPAAQQQADDLFRKKVKLLVCGDRKWTCETSIAAALREIGPQVRAIITGDARGADSIAFRYAKAMGFTVKMERALWRRYGKRAGPMMNQKMLDEFKPNLVFAFHSDLKNSKGTKDMVERARKEGIEVRIFTE